MSTSIGDLALKIAVNSVDFGAGLKAAGAALTSFSTNGQQDVSALATTFRMLKDVASGVYVSMSSSNAVQTQTAQIRDQASIWSKIEDTVGSIAMGYALAQVPLLGLAYQTANVAESTKSWAGDLEGVTKNLASISSFSRMLGDTPTDAQIAINAFERVGFEAGDSRQTIQRFFQRVGEARSAEQSGATGNGTAGALSQLGLSGEQLSHMSTTSALEAVATGLSHVEDRYLRAHLSQEIFGRGYIQLEEFIRRSGPIFEEAKKDVAAFGQNDETVHMAYETQLAWKEVADTWEREVTGPIGAAWNRLWANMDSQEVQVYKGLVSIVPMAKSVWWETGGKYILPWADGKTRGSGTFNTAPGFNRSRPLTLDDTDYSQFDYGRETLRINQLYSSFQGALPTRLPGETMQEREDRTTQLLRGSGLMSSWTPFTSLEQVMPWLQHARPEAFGPVAPNDDLNGEADNMMPVREQMEAMRRRGQRGLDTFGFSQSDLEIHDFRERLRDQFGERDLEGVNQFIEDLQTSARALQELTASTQRFGQSFDRVFSSIDAGNENPLLRFRREVSEINELLPGDENSFRRNEALTFAFERLESSLPRLHDVAGAVRYDSAAGVAAEANARRAATSRDPGQRIERAMDLANQLAQQRTDDTAAIRQFIEQNGLAVARLN